MNTTELINEVALKLDTTKKDAREIVKCVFETISTGLRQNGQVKIQNFGTFECKHLEERVGRNPKTNEEIIIASRNQIYFRSTKALKNSVN
jgi:nucleoid DNA-binding protein